jgi:hypothetical protein
MPCRVLINHKMLGSRGVVFAVLDENVGTMLSMSRGTLSRVCHGMTPYNTIENTCTFPSGVGVYLGHVELVE